MVSLAICDDRPEELAQAADLIELYRMERGELLSCFLFDSPVELAEEYAGGRRFDVALLDVLMPVLDGIELAREIRGYDREVKLLFLSSSPDFAVDSYSVGAYYYVLKPITQKALFPLLDRLIGEIKKEKRQYILVKYKSGLSRVALDELEYCEIMGRTIFYHLSAAHVLEQNGSMAQLEKALLQYPCFVKPHRSYIVNMEHIALLRSGSIQMRSGAIIPIPRGNMQAFQETYLSYFQQRSLEAFP